jgi:hypothetical protein
VGGGAVIVSLGDEQLRGPAVQLGARERPEVMLYRLGDQRVAERERVAGLGGDQGVRDRSRGRRLQPGEGLGVRACSS